MDKKYVTPEQARWLKDKEFNLVCDYMYTDRFPNDLTYNRYGSTNLKSKEEFLKVGTYNMAPEQWEIVEWLRINHNIWIYPLYDGKQWYYQINRTDDPLYCCIQFDFVDQDTPEKAYSAGFDFIFEKLIN